MEPYSTKTITEPYGTKKIMIEVVVGKGQCAHLARAGSLDDLKHGYTTHAYTLCGRRVLRRVDPYLRARLGVSMCKTCERMDRGKPLFENIDRPAHV